MKKALRKICNSVCNSIWIGYICEVWILAIILMAIAVALLCGW